MKQSNKGGLNYDEKSDTVFAGNRACAALIGPIRCVAMITSVLFLSSSTAYALPKEADECTISNGTVTCSSTVVVEDDDDINECRRLPQNCLPIPSRDTPLPREESTNAGRPGGGDKNNFMARLESMNCAELSAQEDMLKNLVVSANLTLEGHERKLKEANYMIESEPYSDKAFSNLDLTQVAECWHYEKIKAARLDSQICTERPGKPEICRPSLPTKEELLQFQKCKSAERDQKSREQELKVLGIKKATAEASIRTWKAVLRTNKQMLNEVRDAKKSKACNKK